MTFRDIRQSLVSLYERAFVPREVFFRSGDRFHHLRLSVRVQKAAACAATLFAAWTLYASGSYVLSGFILASKEAEIERHQLAYFDLLAEVGEYHNQFAKITRDLEENQDYLLSLLEQGPQGNKDLAAVQERLKDSRTEHARVVIARDGLRQKMQQFESDLREIASRNASLQSQIATMRTVVDDSKAERDEVAAARERLNRRLVEVERELAHAIQAKGELETQVTDLTESLGTTEGERAELAEARTKLNARIAGLERELTDAADREAALTNQIAGLEGTLGQAKENAAEVLRQKDYLDRRVAGLEQRLVDLRDAGQSVIERLSERTRLSLDMIEKTVQMTGLDVAALIKQSPDGLLGQGGPFVPADEAASFEPSFQLETSVTTLDQQIDRWTVLRTWCEACPWPRRWTSTGSAPLRQAPRPGQRAPCQAHGQRLCGPGRHAGLRDRAGQGGLRRLARPLWPHGRDRPRLRHPHPLRAFAQDPGQVRPGGRQPREDRFAGQLRSQHRAPRALRSAL